jgi:hypothetical protein
MLLAFYMHQEDRGEQVLRFGVTDAANLKSKQTPLGGWNGSPEILAPPDEGKRPHSVTSIFRIRSSPLCEPFERASEPPSPSLRTSPNHQPIKSADPPGDLVHPRPIHVAKQQPSPDCLSLYRSAVSRGCSSHITTIIGASSKRMHTADVHPDYIACSNKLII